MSLSFDAFAIVLLLAPFAAALLATTISRETGKAAGWILAIVPAALFAILTTTVPDIAAGRPVRLALDWIPALDLRLSFLIDGLSLVFALLITGIGTFIVLYSAAYLDGHPHRGRFLAFMLLFMGAMLGLVLSDSLVALFVFWELTSVTSFLLIGFDHEREAARRGAIQALVVTGVGGLALMAGGVLLHQLSGTWSISDLAASEGLRQAGQFYPWVLAFILVAAFTKSAQWPFHFWLPNAMEAPTPVSAYLHSATMVQAGVYLLARMSPILSGTPQWQVALCVFGGITLLWGGIVALRQTDLKQILAQTTIASLGLSVLLLGLGNEAAAMAVAAYFVAHALYKAALFLVAGIIDHATGTRDITVLGGLRDTLTISFICAALAALSMFGVPPLLGYLAKEEMYAALSYDDAWGIAIIVVLVLGNALLGAAALALVIRPFMGELKPTPKTPHEGNFVLWIGPALFGLIGLAVVFAVGSYGDMVVAPMASSIVGAAVESHLSFGVDLTSLPIWLSVATWALAALIYWRTELVGTVLGFVARAGVAARERRVAQAAPAVAQAAQQVATSPAPEQPAQTVVAPAVADQITAPNEVLAGPSPESQGVEVLAADPSVQPAEPATEQSVLPAVETPALDESAQAAVEANVHHEPAVQEFDATSPDALAQSVVEGPASDRPAQPLMAEPVPTVEVTVESAAPDQSVLPVAEPTALDPSAQAAVEPAVLDQPAKVETEATALDLPSQPVVEPPTPDPAAQPLMAEPAPIVQATVESAATDQSGLAVAEPPAPDTSSQPLVDAPTPDQSVLPVGDAVAPDQLAQPVAAATAPTPAPQGGAEVSPPAERRFTWTWDRGFDQAMFTLIRFAGLWVRAFHHGRLELYLVVTLACLALVMLAPLWAFGGWPSLPRLGVVAYYEWGVVAMAAVGVVMVVFAPTRLGAIIALGIQGLAVALVFMLFGAPDLAFTQLMIETLSVVILALVMTRLRLSLQDPRPYEDVARDGLLAIVIGAATSVLLLRVLQGVFDGRLSTFFARTSVEIAHGRNIVNVILVDYRGLDTLGEITVVMTAGIAVLALLRRQHKRKPPTPSEEAA